MKSVSTALHGKGSARRAANSSAVDAGARAGFAARGVIYVLIGLVALRIAFHQSDGKQADRSGALQEIAEKPFGSVLLWALGIALVGMALWRLSEALFGAAGADGHKAGKRLLSAARFVFYGFVAYSVLSFAAGEKGSGGGSDKQSKDVTAKVMEWTGGRWIVGAAGVGVVVAGVWILVRAALRKYHKKLKLGEMSRRTRRAVDVFGVCGGVARGVLFGTAGAFAVTAAVRYEPGKAKGMDDTLRAFTRTPAGPWLLVVVALGVAAFGVFSFAMARWRKT
ncbi:DUF1206 domain-containing protein [Streptomyces tsukubensis]|uniref:DUF1206 domain-containing protein n=1 Tax=Streptomyces tsukubensis TaxID=83656 RepID=A0A1V3ZZD4_9ACTN|nr:DUF1206 domain-containing protein [Streptomyces tsukubensis]OON71354.1 hypothetical protein B1H18_34125 [Streptomyces tsukubensis]QFR92336.1 DUF1206 domain-containing protein [Streptomyces tsukubensis]